MKKNIFLFLILFLGFKLNSQTNHTNGETLLINPSGRTLMLEKNDNDSWLTFHDPGNYWYSMGIDNSNAGSFSLNSGGDLSSSNFVMNSNGNIGIGTPSPLGKLDILLGGWNNIPRIVFKETGANPAIRLYRPTGTGIGVYSWWIENTGNNGLNFKYGSASSTGNESVISKFTFTNNGDLGIGTSTPDSKLSVNGTIHAKEVKVDLIGWPDYVFKKKYKLLNLKEVEKFIKKNGHLPKISSAEEVEKNGILLGEINKKMLEKIEELTLYTIDQEKKIEDLEIRLKKLELLLLKNYKQ